MKEKFHIYSPPSAGRYSLNYQGDAYLSTIIHTIKRGPFIPKHECPAVVLNRFKFDEEGNARNSYKMIDRTTGWFGLDVDNAGELTNLVKDSLFRYVPYLSIVWVSSRGNGVKAIGYWKLLENLTPMQWSARYFLLLLEINKSCPLKINFDRAMSRCHQPIFINQDRNALVR